MKHLQQNLGIAFGLLTMLSSFNISAALAQTGRVKVDYTLHSEMNQTFAGLLQQAELLGNQLVQQTFAANPGVTEVAVQIVGERNGQAAPLLIATVSRSQWERSPSIQPQSQVFTTARFLLGFVSSGPSPESTNNAPSPPSTQIFPQVPGRFRRSFPGQSPGSPSGSQPSGTPQPLNTTINGVPTQISPKPSSTPLNQGVPSTPNSQPEIRED
jgi:hypothetical protein